MNLFVDALIFLKIAQQTLFNLYVWQLKEYRRDRFAEHMTRTQKNALSTLLHLTLFAPISFHKLPRVTIKASVLFLINLALYYPFFASISPVLPILALLLTPAVFGLSLVALQPPEWLLRQLIYAAARKKISRYQKQYGLVVVGVTGSFGKSTTKSFTAQILSSQFSVLETPKSVNTPLGVSLAILKALTTDHKFFIVEMGAYKIGEIKALCNIVMPQIGIITGISDQHLALFDSQKNIIQAKSELLRALPQNGVAIINKTSKYKPKFNPSTIGEVIYYGIGAPDPSVKKAGLPSFLKVNLEPALILAKLYNINREKVSKVIQKIKLPEKTMGGDIGIRGSTIIDDSFSSNLDGVLLALDHLTSLPFKKKVVVMSCLIELGKLSQKTHHSIGRKLAKTADLTIFTTRECSEDIKKGSGNSKTILLIPNTDDVIKKLKKHVAKSSVVLLEGRIDKKIVDFLRKKDV